MRGNADRCTSHEDRKAYGDRAVTDAAGPLMNILERQTAKSPATSERD